MAYKSGVVTNSRATQLYRELWRRRLRDGAWPYTVGGQVSIEATCLASLALSLWSCDLPMVRDLIHWQNEDGSWPAFVGVRDGSWVTALAGLTLSINNGISPIVERAVHWLYAAIAAPIAAVKGSSSSRRDFAPTIRSMPLRQSTSSRRSRAISRARRPTSSRQRVMA
jgi:hypothetical protein